MEFRGTAEGAQTGRGRGDKEMYSEIRISEGLQLHWQCFIKVKIFAGQKGKFSSLNWSERSDGHWATALISFYGPLYPHIQIFLDSCFGKSMVLMTEALKAVRLSCVFCFFFTLACLISEMLTNLLLISCQFSVIVSMRINTFDAEYCLFCSSYAVPVF